MYLNSAARHPQGRSTRGRSRRQASRPRGQDKWLRAPQKHEVTGKDGKPLSLIPIELARRVLEEVDNEK